MNAYKWGVTLFIAAGIFAAGAVVSFFFNTFAAIGLLLAAGVLCWAGVECFKAVAKAYQDQMRREAAAALSSTEASAEDEEADTDAADADLEDEEDD